MKIIEENCDIHIIFVDKWNAIVMVQKEKQDNFSLCWKCVFYVNSQSSPLSLEPKEKQTTKLLNDACKIFCRSLAFFGVSIQL